ncbi:eukaryotic translation initiation factor 2 subunit 2-like isoform X2 [Saccostrea cucullata]|uniref:eukaryotic translation initiation factor 2 subunit 2-like isoform X2 n=1 Tax=Saccostrea cuccullata TaxID=36930 RepID=UPI002ED0011E
MTEENGIAVHPQNKLLYPESGGSDKDKRGMELENEKGLRPQENDSILSDELNFLGRKKKKRSNKPGLLNDSFKEEIPENIDELKEERKLSEGDYQYEEEHPNLWEQQNSKMRIPAVCAVKEAKKTVLLNFTDICKAIHRPPKHVLDFLFSECATSGSVDIKNRVCLKGNFKPSGLQKVVTNYVREYVMCASCKSFNSLLIRETRLNFVHCEGCGSRRAVNAVKSGFRAVTSRDRHR